MQEDPDVYRVVLGGFAVEIENYARDISPALSFLLKDTYQEGGELQTRFIIRSGEPDKSGKSNAKFTVSRKDKVCHRSETPGRVCTYLIGEIIFHLIDNNSSDILIHTACISRNGAGILLPGVSGAGKSTLTTWMLTRGYRYLTDEIIALNPDTLEAQALTRPLNLKRTGWDAVVTNELGDVRNAEKLDGSVSHLVEHRAFNPDYELETVQIKAVVFPRFSASADFSLEPISSAKTAMLMMQTFVNARNHPGHGFPAITSIARAVSGYELRYSKFEQLEVLDTELRNLTNGQC